MSTYMASVISHQTSDVMLTKVFKGYFFLKIFLNRLIQDMKKFIFVSISIIMAKK